MCIYENRQYTVDLLSRISGQFRSYVVKQIFSLIFNAFYFSDFGEILIAVKQSRNSSPAAFILLS